MNATQLRIFLCILVSITSSYSFSAAKKLNPEKTSNLDGSIDTAGPSEHEEESRDEIEDALQKAKKPKKFDDTKKKEYRPQTAADGILGPSAINRLDKSSEWLFAASMRLYGDVDEFGQLEMVDLGLRYGRFATPNFKYGLEASQTSFSYKIETIGLDPFGDPSKELGISKGSGQTFKPFIQYILSNSFSAKANLRYSMGKLNDVDFTMTGVDAALGNQWSWDSFTLSFDYLTYGKNLSWKFGEADVLKGAKKGPITSFGQGLNLAMGFAF
ncbi:MAG: hypothetical protein EOP06_05265 [Proteobacteria bacterium]|nr:MAG: hypothetical protein EOP06_05265 [Pseudomonadota bacterium]